jgi:uncharacterized radical SAM superfamily Fe-S cluster-containing enzyme
MQSVFHVHGVQTTRIGELKMNQLRLELPRIVESICPECRTVIPAREFEAGGKVMMEKSCPKHGQYTDVIFSNADIYRGAGEWYFEDGKGITNPTAGAAIPCPDRCGICDQHTSHTCVANINLTNRCNLRCPICFADADAEGYLYEPSYEQVIQMLKTYRNEQPVPAIYVQFSGGEPTLHPRFFEIVQAAKALKFDHIQIASNGLKLSDIRFAEQCAEAGLHTVYLQFDAVTDDVYLKLRGRALLDQKMRAVENVRKMNMRIILVPTIVKGINDHQTGKIVQFALNNLDVIFGISFQPVAFTGRISKQVVAKGRVTLSDLAIWVEEQTGFADARKDWFPLSALVPFSNFGGAVSGREITTVSCHPHCALCTFFFVDKKTGVPVPVTRFIDLKELLFEISRLSRHANPTQFQLISKVKLWNKTKKYFHPEKAPSGLTFRKFLQALDGYASTQVSRGPDSKKHLYPNLFVAGMHFMDAYNYDLERVRRCIIHYAAPDGRIVPFCSYNSGPVFRETIEKRYSMPE